MRMSGGFSRWRLRLECGVSPVRVSMRDRQAHLRDRRFEIARDVDGERLERRNIERVDAACADAGCEFDEARQEAGKRLAAAGRRDEQHIVALRRMIEQRQLMRPRRPAAPGEPVLEKRRQQRGRGQSSPAS